MSNASTTVRFLQVVDCNTKAAILASIGKHYGITPADAFAEVTDHEAEHLLDYMTEPQRGATHLLMRRHGLSA